MTWSVLGLTLTRKQTLGRCFLLYSPTIAIAILGYIWKGDQESARAMCMPLRAIYSINCTNNSAFKYIGYSLGDALKDLLELHAGKLHLWLFSLGVNSAILLRVSSLTVLNRVRSFPGSLATANADASPDSRLLTNFSLKYGLIPFLFSLPIYLIAWDWGRWYFIVAIGYSLAVLTPTLIWLDFVKLSPPFTTDERGDGFFKNVRDSCGKTVNFLAGDLHPFRAFYWFIFVYTIFLPRIPTWNMKYSELSSGFLYLFWSRVNR
jgi:hypothetical protein